jgi:hypothetical protein
LITDPRSEVSRLYDGGAARFLGRELTRAKSHIYIFCLILLMAFGLHAQSTSDFAESRSACALGRGGEVVNRANAMGFRVGLAEACVKALTWAASNSRLLDLYADTSGQANARGLVERITDNARASTTPFRLTGSAQEMLNNGHLIPSIAFDAGFTRGYLERTSPPSGSMDMPTLNRRTEECLTEVQSLSVCAEVGRIQGALANQMNNAFSNSGSNSFPAPRSESQGPDRASTEAAVNQKFLDWSRSWSMDRYSPGSAHVDGVDCSRQCKASGRFTFTRWGAPHTIAFVAFMESQGDGSYRIGRLCYDDNTSNMRDCTD